MRQLTWNQANEISAKAADKATGFDRIPADEKTITINGETLRRILEASAFHALRDAGCLADDTAQSNAWNDQKAAKATREYSAWKRATKSAF